MHVLMVSPRTPATFWSFEHVLPFVGRKAAFPPLGLLTVAAMLPREWTIELVDLNTRPLRDGEIDRADVLFISAMIVHEASAREVIARAKARGKPVVAGGPLFTTGSERFPEVDSCVIGEAEDLMPSLVADLEGGRLRTRYVAERKPDVSRTPLPRWDLLRLRDYATMPLQFSRGCPFDCEFCDITAVYGRVPRVKTPDQMITELESLLGAGWKGHIFVVDDNFIGHKVKVKALLHRLIKWRRERRATVTFSTEASMNLADDPELIDLMVRAGFKRVFIGIESPQEESLNECRKVQNTRRDLVETIRALHRAGLAVMGGFIVGFDHDREGIFAAQRRFIQDSGVVTAMVGLLTALPGTKLHTRLTREGRLLGPSTGNNLDTTVNFVPTLARSTLVEGYRELVKHLYAPSPYYRRIRTFLRDYRPGGPSMRFELDDLVALIRSMWVLGVAQPGRLQYWQLLVQAALMHPRAFGEAMSLAIMGYHFRTVARHL